MQILVIKNTMRVCFAVVVTLSLIIQLVSGTATVSGPLVTANSVLDDGLGNTTIHNNVTVGGNLVVANLLTVTGNVQIQGSLTGQVRSVTSDTTALVADYGISLVGGPSSVLTLPRLRAGQTIHVYFSAAGTIKPSTGVTMFSAGKQYTGGGFGMPASANTMYIIVYFSTDIVYIK